MKKYLVYILLLFPFLFENCDSNNGGDPVPFDTVVADWTRQFIILDADLHDVYLTPEGFGFAVGNISTVYTSSTGQEWSLAPISGEPEPSYRSVFFIDVEKGWIVGSRNAGQGGMVYYSGNSGAYPELQYETDDTLNIVFFIDELTGWAAGEKGLVIRTTNGGENWMTGSIGAEETVFDLQFFNKNIGWAVTTNGGIYRSADGGITWKAEYSESAFDVRAVYFTDTLHMWACGARNSILKRSFVDSAAWSRETIVIETPNIIWKDIYFINATTGWLIGQYHSIYKTEDAGLTWESETIETTFDISAIHMVNETKGNIVGEKGTIFRYTPLDN
ncbi:MAG TPA: YCF48-related protein [Cyclobacteriaceae bacterium]|nr:YCF48-related protein [Cyclobacteriaceae bacterium]